MSKDKTEYPNVALTGDLRSYLAKLNLPKVSQSGERVYIQYGSGKGEEYTAIYCLKEGKRFLEFHLENPINNVFSALETKLMSQEAIEERVKNEKYSKIFGAIKLERSRVPYKEEAIIKEVESIAAVTRIKKVPLGKKRHLSGDFSEFIFKYIIQPFIQTVEGHKSMLP